jgi:quinoprotein glucose dehydrogenase
VAQPTKQGLLFVFNRVTGDPIWPIEEYKVPQTDVPGEWTSPTQPFPTAPPPFARLSFTEKDVNPFLSPAEQEEIRERLRASRNEGIFTPPSLKGTIQMPGSSGGANWGSSAVDPTKGTMYVVSKELPMAIKLVPPVGLGAGAISIASTRGPVSRSEACPFAAGASSRVAAPAKYAAPTTSDIGIPAGRMTTPAPPVPAPPATFIHYDAPYDFMNQTSCGLSMIGPPWSQLTAYDLNKGTILWQVPNGGIAALEAEGIANTGAWFPRGGVVVTAGGLIFVGTATDRTFRAYDQNSGKILWEYKLPAGTEGVPAVYQVGGREYVVIPAGGDGQTPPDTPRTSPAPGAYIAFALPKK